MSRHVLIKYLDKYGIRDGLVRELIVRGQPEMLKPTIKQAIWRREQQIAALQAMESHVFGGQIELDLSEFEDDPVPASVPACTDPE